MANECDECGKHALECKCPFLWKRTLVCKDEAKDLISEWGGILWCLNSKGQSINMADELNQLERKKQNEN